jgi:hypothetical protein
MLIGIIVNSILFIFTLLLFFYALYTKNRDDINIDQVYYQDKSTNRLKCFVLCILFFSSSMFFISSLFFLLDTTEATTLWMVFVIGCIFLLIGIATVSHFIFYRIIIINDSIVIKKMLTKTKTIKISSIIYVDQNSEKIHFLNQAHQLLFSIEQSFDRLDEFISRISSYNLLKTRFNFNSDYSENKNIHQEFKINIDYSDERFRILESLGSEYRLTFPRKIRNAKLNALFSLLIIPAIITILYLIDRNSVYFMFLIFSPILPASVWYVEMGTIKKEMQKSDLDLGLLSLSTNKRVVGSNRQVFKNRVIPMIILLILTGSATIFLFFMGLNQKEPDYNEMTLVEGNVASVKYEHNGRDEYIEIRIEQDSTSYRVPSILIDYFDIESLLSDVMVGDNAKLYVDSYHETSSYGEDITLGWLYYVKVNNVEYLGEEEMLLGYNRNLEFGLYAFYILLGFSIIPLTSILVESIRHIGNKSLNRLN